MSTTSITAEPGSPQIRMSREFDAPPETLLRAWTDPDLIVRWLGPRYLSTTMDDYVAGHGGRYEFTQTAPDGETHVFRGVIHGEPSVETGLVQTFEYLGTPGHVSLDSITFERRGDRTVMHTNAVFQTVEARDAMLTSGMEFGVNEGYERLDELIAEATSDV